MSESWKIGDLIEGQYEIFEIKHGGMGIVFLCADYRKNFLYAVKTFKDRYLSDPETIRRFIWEGEAWIRLEKHRNIVQGYWLASIQDRPYIFLEIVTGDKHIGPTLRDWIRKKALDIKTSLDFTVQFCLGMEHAQWKFTETNQRFIHRDIKPENIMVTANKIVKVTDFGLVKAFSGGPLQDLVNVDKSSAGKFDFTRMGGACGTPPYMSPEQCRGDAALDTRSDIYSFGCVLYEMFAGKPPFPWGLSEGADKKYLKSHLEEPPVSLEQLSPDIPGKLSRVIMKCLEKIPERRWNSFTELRNSLEEIYYDHFGERVNEESRALELTPKELVNKGISLSMLHREQDAIECLNRALDLDPKDELAWNSKGVALVALERNEEAIECFKQALQLNPGFVDALNNQGWVLSIMGMPEAAIECYNRALELNPNATTVWENKGKAFATLGLGEEAIGCYEQVLKRNPGDENAWCIKGNLLLYLGRYEEAIACYDQTIQLNSSYDLAWRNQGIAFASLGRFEAALISYDQALQLNPVDDEAWHYKGNILSKLGRKEEAIIYYNHSLELNPKQGNAWYDKGNALLALGRIQEAINCYDQVLQINPDFKEAGTNKGVAFATLGRNEAAIECYNQVLRRHSEHKTAWNNKGLALLNLERYEEALECFQRSLEIDPRDDEAWAEQGAVLYILDKPEAAIESLDQALQINPGHIKAWYNKENALMELERYQEAYEVFTDFIKLAPPHYTPYIEEIRERFQGLGFTL
ncbi:MAG TPA: tetratricopeptide repeat protein [Bacillota bacterium]|nr:tetratricopeptide repeat protein [Bacillota bacterium]